MDAANKIHAEGKLIAIVADAKLVSAPKTRKISKAELKKVLPFRGMIWLPDELEPIQHPPVKARGGRRKSADCAKVNPVAPDTESKDPAEVEEIYAQYRRDV